VKLHSTYARAVYPAWFIDPELASRFTPPEALSDTGAAVLARLRRDGYDWRPIVKTISCPTLVVHGEDDALPLAVSRTNSYIIEKARFEPIPRSGHMPFWEAPSRFFALVESFLS
jgi:pimeloyl-ACP methyl ester carboxylesterase